MRNIRKFLIIIVSVLLSVSLAYAQLTTSQIVKKYSPSIVTIVALDQNDQPLSLGSGFFINTDGDIATNHHVLEGSAKAIIKTVDNKKGEVLGQEMGSEEMGSGMINFLFMNTFPSQDPLILY